VRRFWCFFAGRLGGAGVHAGQLLVAFTRCSGRNGAGAATRASQTRANRTDARHHVYLAREHSLFATQAHNTTLCTADPRGRTSDAGPVRQWSSKARAWQDSEASTSRTASLEPSTASREPSTATIHSGSTVPALHFASLDTHALGAGMGGRGCNCLGLPPNPANTVCPKQEPKMRYE
jgi:hypothetical protein